MNRSLWGRIVVCVFATLATSGCAGDHCSDSPSGADACTLLSELSPSEVVAHCDYLASVARHTIFSCEGEEPYLVLAGTYDEAFESCLFLREEAETPLSECDPPVGVWETCVTNIVEDGCAYYTDYRCPPQYCEGWQTPVISDSAL